MATSPVETYNAIESLINSGDILGNISAALKQEYSKRINNLIAEYEKAGASGSYNAGVEIGKLLTDIGTVAAGGVGIGKGIAKPVKPELDNISQIAFDSAKDNVFNWTPKDKHMLGTTATRSAQFNTNNVADIQNLVQEALKSPNAKFLPNNQDGSFRVVTNMNRPIGTKGQTSIRIIIGNDGTIWNAFPVNGQ